MNGIWPVIKQEEENKCWQGVLVLAFNPSTQEAEEGRQGPAWSTEEALGQPGLHREILSQKTKINKQNPN